MLCDCLRTFRLIIWSRKVVNKVCMWLCYATQQVKCSNKLHALQCTSVMKLWHNHLSIVQFFAEGSGFQHLNHLGLPVVGDKVRTCYTLITQWYTHWSIYHQMLALLLHILLSRLGNCICFWVVLPKAQSTCNYICCSEFLALSKCKFFKDKNFSIYMYKIGYSLSQPCTSEWIIANVCAHLCGTAKWASLYYYLCSKI